MLLRRKRMPNRTSQMAPLEAWKCARGDQGWGRGRVSAGAQEDPDAETDEQERYELAGVEVR